MTIKTYSKWIRIISMLLVFVMVLGVMPVIAISENEIDEDARISENIAIKQAFNELDGINWLETTSSSGYIKNSYIEAYIASNGQFTMGTVDGDPNSDTDDDKKLLFGHPSPWSSETLVRIDGNDYKFENYIQSVSINDDQTECVVIANIQGIVVKQILTLTKNPYTNLEDVISIRYTYTNKTSSVKQIGIRIMLDTMLGNNDGSPFRVNGENVVTEKEYSGNNVPQYWQSFDSLTNPNVTATGFFYYSEEEAPDKVQFAHWGSVLGSSWNFQINKNRAVTGDSAVAIYFNPKTVPTNGSNSIVTYYGVSGFSDENTDLTGSLSVRVTAPTILTSNSLLEGYSNNPFDISAYLSNDGEGILDNVHAVLSLDPLSDALELDEHFSAIISVGDLGSGDNKSVKWTVRAIPQIADTEVKYSILFYSDSTLLKTISSTIELKGILTNALYRSVKYDMNDGTGEIYYSQSVLLGQRVTKPEDPSREGYAFKGWYANPECTGWAWFNILNFWQGDYVYDNVTLYAKWEKNAQNIKYGKDNYNFENNSLDFFGSGMVSVNWWTGELSWKDSNNPGTYEITGDYKDILMNQLLESARTDMDEIMQREWDGSCFGMSAVLAMIRAGKLDVEFFQTNANTLHKWDKPHENPAVFNVINVYHLMQFFAPIYDVVFNDDVERLNNEKIIQALDESLYPVEIIFDIYNNNSAAGAHAVVAFGYEETDEAYLVDIWDPCYKNDANVLTISKDFATSTFEDVYDEGSKNSVIRSALSVESGVLSYLNVQDELLDLGKTSGAEGVSMLTLARTADTSMYLTTNYSDFVIGCSNGTFAVIENGVKVSGNLDISDGACMNELGAELSLRFRITKADTETYHVYPSEMVSVVTGEPIAEYKTVFLYNDAVDGFYAGVTAGGLGRIAVASDGTLSTEFDSATKQKITVTANDVTTTWYAVNVELTDAWASVTPNSASTDIHCPSGAEITVTANDDYNTLVFDTFTMGVTNTISLVESKDEKGTGILGDLKETMGRSLIFYSMGGTPIKAQNNIPVGATATRPTDPTRAGFVFAGWYTVSTCEDGYEWNFNTPIAEDTRIYAKWLPDDNFAHTVTFKIEGMDDIIYIVYNGESLTNEQLPKIPNKPGYIAMWDINDFTNITSDISTKAIYQIDENWDGYVVTFDPNGGTVSPTTMKTSLECTLEEFPVPERDGYIFEGWYTDIKNGEKVEADSMIFEGDTTLYAHWIEDESDFNLDYWTMMMIVLRNKK